MIDYSKYVEDSSIGARKEEIDIKVKRIQKFLEERDLNALYLTKQQNFFWITAGADAVVTICVEDAVAPVLITREGRRIIITNVIELGKLREEEHLEELGFELVSQEWFENKNIDYIKQFAGDLSKVACDIHFADCIALPGEINKMHYSLTHGEICRYQTLGNTMSAALEEYLHTVRPGMTEFDVVGGIAGALWPKQIGQVLFLVSSDERVYKHRHAVPRDKKIEKLLCVSCNGRYKGLITTTSRVVHFGKPSDELLERFDKTVSVECRMIAATKPGVDDLVPHLEGKKALEEYGYGSMYYRHAQGGPQSYYNRYANTSENCHRVVEENQCYCYQPVIDGAKAEDAFIATKEGPIMVTKPVSFPKIEKTFGGIDFQMPGLLVID